MLKEVVRGLLSPARRKAAAKMLMERYCASERKACALVGCPEQPGGICRWCEMMKHRSVLKLSGFHLENG